MESLVKSYPLCRTKVEQGLQKLPVLCTTVSKLIELTQRDDVNVDRVVKILAHDPALSARLLRIANSPFFGLSGKITSIGQACMMLGMNTVRTSAVAVGMASCLYNDGAANEQDDLWRLAVRRAVAAQSLAGHSSQDKETAFTGGILYDLGKMAMALCFDEDVQAVAVHRNEHGSEQREAEAAIFGMCHRELGGMLADRWSLPMVIRQIISTHPDVDGDGYHPLVDVVALADVTCDGGFSNFSPDRHRSLPVKSVQRLGLDDSTLHSWLADVDAKQDMAALLL